MDYKIVEMQELLENVNSQLPLMFDTETLTLYGKIRLAQFYQDGWDRPLLVEYPNPFELVALLSNQHEVVMHNAHYDITTIQEQLGKQVWLPNSFNCTFLLARLHFFLKQEFSLDKVCSYVLGYNPYPNKKESQGSDWSKPVLDAEQLNYAASDVVYLQQVYNVVKNKIDDFSYKLDLLTLKNCLSFQNNGMPIDIVKLEQAYFENTQRINEIALPINCNSYQQVRKYIDSENSDDLGLASLALNGNEKAKAVRETRKLKKSNSFLTKFNDTLENNGNGYGVIYGKFKCSPRSGRTASDNQNLQQLPRSLKKIFGVQEDGDNVIIYSDFSQMQLRAVCAKTADKTMEKLFRQGEDIHSYVAKMIFGENFTKTQRQICKTANFGLLFGAGIQVFLNILMKQANLKLSFDEGSDLKEQWIKLWKEIEAWQEKGIEDWRHKKPWQTPLGRRYVAKMMTDQLAMQIQGFEAEVAKLAMHYMLPKLKEVSNDILLRNFIHDSYIFTAPNNSEIYKEASYIIADSMQEAWSQISQNLPINDLPMPVNVRVGWNWGDIESDKYIYEHIKE